MCNLYTNKTAVQEMANLFGTPVTHGSNAPDDVYRGYPGMVVREHEGARVLQSMTWGFPVRLKGMKPTSKPKPVNNARDDKLLTPFWKHWFTTPAHRCLIPFTAFAEAEGPKGKMTRTWISVEDQPTAAWAGLWRPTDEWGNCFTGVMVDATEELWDIHDRMPVILHPDEHDAWLNCPAEDAVALVCGGVWVGPGERRAKRPTGAQVLVPARTQLVANLRSGIVREGPPASAVVRGTSPEQRLTCAVSDSW